MKGTITAKWLEEHDWQMTATGEWVYKGSVSVTMTHTHSGWYFGEYRFDTTSEVQELMDLYNDRCEDYD